MNRTTKCHDQEFHQPYSVSTCYSFIWPGLLTMQARSRIDGMFLESELLWTGVGKVKLSSFGTSHNERDATFRQKPSFQSKIDPCAVNIQDICTKPTPLCSPSSLPSNKNMQIPFLRRHYWQSGLISLFYPFCSWSTLSAVCQLHKEYIVCQMLSWRTKN